VVRDRPERRLAAIAIEAPPVVADIEDPLARSQLLRAEDGRRRLERILLMLPAALQDFTPAHAAELFCEAVADIAEAQTVVGVLPDHSRQPIAFGIDPEEIPGLSELSGAAPLAPAFDGNVVYIGDTASLPDGVFEESFPGALGDRAFRSLVALPVRGHRPRPYGVLFMTHRRRRAFSERQIALAGALTAPFGRMLELSDAVTEQKRISTALQESLLPPLLPAIPRLDLAAVYQPSGYGNLVGGDFYDLAPNSVGGCDILLGDASGVGPEAAGLAGIARYTARALAESGRSPSEILSQLNTAIVRAATDGRFCTATLARLHLDEADASLPVELASSGHPPAIVIRRDRTVTTANSETGMALGIIDQAPVAQVALTLEAGDALVLYTDGVVEARNPGGELFGQDRLLAVLALAAGRSAEGIARRLELAVRDHRGQRQGDDVAIVVVRFQAELRKFGGGPLTP
jgi:serine phosphatase RsbU (regulator of sigma subunit)